MHGLCGSASPVPGFWSSRMPRGRWNGLRALLGQAVVERRQPRLVLHPWIGKRRLGVGLVRVLAALAVNVVEPLRLEEIRVEIAIIDRPGRRDTAIVVPYNAEILAAWAHQRSAVDLGIAAHDIMHHRRERLAVGAVPGFCSLVAALVEDGGGVPILLLALQVVAALKDEDALAGRREALRHRGPPGPAADHNEVVMVLVHAGPSSPTTRVFGSSSENACRRELSAPSRVARNVWPAGRPYTEPGRPRSCLLSHP